MKSSKDFVSVFCHVRLTVGAHAIYNVFNIQSKQDTGVRMNRFVSKILIGTASTVILSFAAVGTSNAASLPSAYQYDVEELQQIYPGTRMQGSYNTCWAFSAVGLAEFDLIHDDKIADRSLDLSELQLAYYTYHNEEDPLGGTYEDMLRTYQYLNSGGNLTLCARTLLQWQGLIPEASLPYGKASKIWVLDSSYAFSKDVAHLQNVYILNIHNEPQNVKKEIVKHGSAGISLHTGDQLGVYDSTAFYEQTGETVATFYCPTDIAADHAVNIVGWDDDFPATNFKTTPEGDGAWLVRNSWSDETGNDIKSYFWISYYDKGIDDDVWIMDFEPADNYDFNYQYDGCSSVSRGFKTQITTKYANVFEVKGAANEQLRAVAIALNEDRNVPYTIKVYTNLAKRSNPRSGILAATVSGKTTYAGNYTIPLKKAVSVAKGTYYSVVVEIGNKTAGIDMEQSGSNSHLMANAYIDYNQSFIYRNGRWIDFAEFVDQYNYSLGNLCIKAFSDKSGASIGKVTNARIAGTAKNTAKLNWTKVSGAKGYEVYRATSKNGTYKKVATTKRTSYQDKDLSSGKTYYYKVRAYKMKGNRTVAGSLSSVVTAKTK